MQTVFIFSSRIRPLVQVVCVSFVAAFGLPHAPYMGFCARLAGRCPAQASPILFGFSSGLDGILFNIFLSPSSSLSLFSSGSGAGR
ncbi:MAG: hypothetical protein JSR71_14720 [Proteobacteria bacterium]|nr:hypothetical protein [Pseudomonadota bacterium]